MLDDRPITLRRMAPSVFLPAIVYEIGNGAIAPVIALTALDVGASASTAAFLLALLGVGQIMGDVPAAALADRIGERRAMVLAAGVAILAMIACYFAGTLYVLGLALVVIGASNATFYLARQSYLTEVAPVQLRARAMSTLGGSHRIGLFIGPFVGALAISIGGMRAAYIVAMLAAASAATLLLLIPDVVSEADRPAPVRGEVGAWSMLRDHRRLFATLGLAVLAVGAVRAARQTVLPLWAEHLGLSPASTSVMFGIAGAVDMALFYPSGKVMDRHGRLTVALPSMIILGGAMMAIPLTGGIVSLTVVAMVMSFGNGIGSGIMMTLGADTAPAENRSRFLAVWRLFSDSGNASGPVIVSVVGALATLAAGIVTIGAVGWLAAAALARWVPRYSAYATPRAMRAHRRGGCSPPASDDRRRPPVVADNGGHTQRNEDSSMDAVTRFPVPRNEPVLTYPPGSPERAALLQALDELTAAPIDLPCTIDGVSRMGGGVRRPVVQPHSHSDVLGEYAEATTADGRAAIDSALGAAPAWRDLPYEERAAVFLRAADLLAGPWRARLNAATMLGQSKTAIQAEIDSACELIDFWRYNVAFGEQVLALQPDSSPGIWNRLDHRPLEGFVYAITPFNFTAIAGNLPTAPALMGNVVIWKPSETQTLAAVLTMQLLVEAGLPAGVINLLTGDGRAVSEVALAHPDLAGIHFTGSTPTFQHLWQQVGSHIGEYRTYPRLVGETGGKDFVLAHSSADPDALLASLVRGAFEYQGQKCSAASRAYLPVSLWDELRPRLVEAVDGLAVGDVRDLSNFMGAVIDRRAFDRLAGVLDRAKNDPAVEIIAGGTADDSTGFFVRPTLLVCADPSHEIFRDEYFGPILAIHVYDDSTVGAFGAVLDIVDSATKYGLTGAVIATDRAAILAASRRLRFAAGNFYVNDKPTGAVVGQQPFGGSRGSGTNDKAGSILNLQRWISPRAIKETFVTPTAIEHPHQSPEQSATDGAVVADTE